MNKIKYFTIMLYCFCGLSASAQDTHSKKNKWNFYVESYMMIPNMKGETGIKDLPNVNVDADAGDIFSHLQIGAMLYTEAYNEHFAITSDILYMNLKQDATPSTLINNGKVNMKEFA